MANPTQLTLWCGSYRSASRFPIEIDREAKVADLRVAIYKQRYSVLTTRSAIELVLYVTKHGPSCEWLADEDASSVLRGPIDQRYKEMLPTWPLYEYFGDQASLGDRVIHVLVDLPPDPLVEARGQVPVWPQAPPLPHAHVAVTRPGATCGASSLPCGKNTILEFDGC